MTGLDEVGVCQVLIIGGGLGGLALAQALHKNHVPFELFEHDTTPTGCKQGWAVTLRESIPVLERILPEETAKRLHQTSVNHNLDVDDEFGFVDITSGERVALSGGKPLGQPGAILRANRSALRSFLWNENSLPIKTGKQFMRYEVDQAGVTAFFEDGTNVRGSILVGADGLHSQVRSQLVDPEHRPVLSRCVPIYGEIDLDLEQYEVLYALANAGVLAVGPGIRLFIGPLAMEDDRSSARFYWGLIERSAEPEILSDWIQNATNQQRYEYAVEKLGEMMHPKLKKIIELGGPEAILTHQPKFIEFLTPETIPEGRITILGDAAHAMVPFRGIGANTAFLDVGDLANLLVTAYEEGQGLSSVLPAYLAKMNPRGRQAVLSSRAGGDNNADDPRIYFNNFTAKI